MRSGWALVVGLLLFGGLAHGALAGLAFEDDLRRVREEIEYAGIFNARTCADYVARNTDFLYTEGAGVYLPRDASDLEILRRRAPDILNAIFALRLRLGEKLRAFHEAGELQPACLDAIRRALRYARFVDELIAEWWTAQSRPAGEASRDDTTGNPMFEGEWPALLVNPAFRGPDIQSGDILLTRSPFFVSATIARIGDEDGQFSHAALAHRDSDGRITVLEALIDHGVVAVPWERWVAKTGARALLLRHRDAEAARAAADWAFDWVSARPAADPIPYDFRIDYSDRSEIFCLELVRVAFDESSRGRVKVPTFPSSLRLLAGSAFLQQLGVRGEELFTPSDLEVDPALDLVAEWRNLDLTPRARAQDAVLSSVFDWMSVDGYVLTLAGGAQVLAGVVWDWLRPLGLLRSKIPSNMTREFMQTTLALRTVTGLLEKEIEGDIESARSRLGLGMDFKAMRAALDAFRRADCIRHRERRAWEREQGFLHEETTVPPRGILHPYLDVPAEAGGCPATP